MPQDDGCGKPSDMAELGGQFTQHDDHWKSDERQRSLDWIVRMTVVVGQARGQFSPDRLHRMMGVGRRSDGDGERSFSLNMGFRGVVRQREGKGGSTPLLTLDPDSSTVNLDDVFGDCESQASAV